MDGSVALGVRHLEAVPTVARGHTASQGRCSGGKVDTDLSLSLGTPISAEPRQRISDASR